MKDANKVCLFLTKVYTSYFFVSLSLSGWIFTFICNSSPQRRKERKELSFQRSVKSLESWKQWSKRIIIL